MAAGFIQSKLSKSKVKTKATVLFDGPVSGDPCHHFQLVLLTNSSPHARENEALLLKRKSNKEFVNQ